MKLLKTLIIALVGLAFTNCTSKTEEQVQKIEPPVANLEQAKADFEANYRDHLHFVLKRTNQLRRNELVFDEVLLQEFESQWSAHFEKLQNLKALLSEEELKVYLSTKFEELQPQGIVATPCYDAYVKSLNQADSEFLLCAAIGVVTGGEALPVCVIYYFNSLRKAILEYEACMSKEYGGKE